MGGLRGMVWVLPEAEMVREVRLMSVSSGFEAEVAARPLKCWSMCWRSVRWSLFMWAIVRILVAGGMAVGSESAILVVDEVFESVGCEWLWCFEGECCCLYVLATVLNKDGGSFDVEG